MTVAKAQKKGRPTPARATPAQKAREAELSEIDRKILDGESALAELGAIDDSPIGPDGEIRPVEIGKTGLAGREMQHIFSIGDEKFFIPKVIPPAKLLAFQLDLAKFDRDTAVGRLMTNIMGEKAIHALAASDEVSEDDMARVFLIVGTVAFGALKKLREAQDPSSRGQ